jgi:hypothetical protein
VNPLSTFRLSKLVSIVCILLATMGYVSAEAPDEYSSLKIDFPKDSPVAVVSADWGQSKTFTHGSVTLLDLQALLTLRNSAPRRIRGVSLMLAAGEMAGGKGLVNPHGLNVAQGDTFPVHIDLRLLRPLKGTPPPVQIALDGVLFDDLMFYGPDKSSSRVSLTARELEAQRDRRDFQLLLASGGAGELRKQVLTILSHTSDRLATGARIVRGRASNFASERGDQQTPAPSPEKERLVGIYRKSGIKALIAELKRF